MLSFRSKIVVSLVSLSLISFALGAYKTRAELIELFDVLMIDRTSHTFRYNVAEYYNTYGSWNAAIEVESFQEFKQRTIPPPRVTYRNESFLFVGTDLDGRVVVPGETEQFRLGTVVSEQRLANSIFLRGDGENPIGYVLSEGETPPNEVEQVYLQSLQYSWWISALLVIAVSLPLGFFLGGRLTKPINNLISAISKMTPTDLHQQVPVYSKDELGKLSLNFNQMSTDLADFVQVVKNQKEKISQTEQLLRQGLTNISHELRTPLHVSINQTQAMLDGIRNLDKAELSKVNDSLMHLSHLVDDLYFLSACDAKALKFEFEIVDLCEIIQLCLDTRIELFEQREFNLKMNLPNKYEYDGDKTRLRQVVDNLLSNCLRYSEQGANITVELHTLANTVELIVSDSGPGVAPENLEFLFDRFYKTEQSKNLAVEGLGLGLSVVKTCAEIHGGEVSACINDKGGLSVQLSLPTSPNRLMS